MDGYVLSPFICLFIGLFIAGFLLKIFAFSSAKKCGKMAERCNKRGAGACRRAIE